MNILKVLLTPLLPLYAMVVFIRNKFFDTKLFKAKRVKAKVISVGNITVGGSGKTPMVIYLLNLLKKMDLKPGVLSRGYGRKSKGYVLVYDGEQLKAPVEICGDEMYQTVTETKVPGAVSEKRAYGAERLIEDTGIDIIVLDDGFQHRWIHRDVDIVVCEQRFLLNKGFTNMNLLPAGNMRESFSAIKRADAIVINRKFSEDCELPSDILKHYEGKPLFKAHYKALCFVDVKRKIEHPIEEFKGQKGLVVSGIANPFSLINILRQLEVNTDNQILFRDHKNYSVREIQEIRKAFYAYNAHSVITTQKDAVKLMSFAKDFDDIDIFYLKIKMQMDNEDRFISFIKNKIKQT